MRRVALKKMITLVLLALLPVVVMVLGLRLLLHGEIFNLSFGITFVAIPAVTILLLAWLILSKWKAIWKVLVSILLLGIFLVVFVFSTGVGYFEHLHYQKDGKIGEEYAEVCRMFPTMPTLDELGDYERLEYYNYFSTFLIYFTCDGDTLIAHYDLDEYQAQKAMLEEKFVFENDESEGVQYACELEGYSFRMLDADWNGEYVHEIEYPKRVILIATNDQTQTIAYTAFRDDDLDQIPSLEEFLLCNCGWKYILK